MISKRNYFTIFILLAMVFVMFMFVGVSSSLLSDANRNNWSKEREKIRAEDTLTAASLNLDALPFTSGSTNGANGSDNASIGQGTGIKEEGGASSGTGRTVNGLQQKSRIAILSKSADDKVASVLIEWCVYNKYLYKVYTQWPEKEVISDYDVVLFGNFDITGMDYDKLSDYAKLGKIFIFTQLPDYQTISTNSRLAAYYGIKAPVRETVKADGIKIFDNFMINKVRSYSKGDYFGEEDDTSISIPYYSLAAGYDVYAVGTFDHQDKLGILDKNLPPLLWRTATDQSMVFVINSDIFQGVSLLGILTGFMSHASQCYLYPIVNAQTISLLDYPYFSNENLDTSKMLYSRTTEVVTRDLLWPNIVQILKNYGNSYSFFAAPQLDYQDDIEAKGDYVDFYLREVAKLPGAMGLSLNQHSNAKLSDIISKDTMYFQNYMPDYDITALYTGGFSTGEVADNLDKPLLQKVSLIMSDYKEGDKMLSYLKDDVVSVKFNLNGYRHETMDDLQMICLENAIGMCNEKVDIGPVIYPESRLDQWNFMSLKWSKGDTYFKDFSKFDMVSIYEMENRVRRFLALDYSYGYDGNTINIHIDHFSKEAYFILSIFNSDSRKIERVENGSAEAISASAYLVKATGEDVHIYLQEENMLEKPKNNKEIPSNPLKSTVQE
jgi:Uncharacterized protein conserved in bacteria (DUF2194).